MEKQNRIHWKKGLDITPEILIGADNYHAAERNLLGRFIAFQSYGILPDSQFYIEKNTGNNSIYINNLECLAITQNGYVINIQKDTSFKKKIELNETDTECYVILAVNPYLPLGEKELSDYAEYDFTLQRIQEPIENGIPVLKIIKDKIDEAYIPPSIALNSVNSLMYKYAEIKNIINEIIKKIPEDNTLYLQIIMLQLELDNYSSQESPKEFVLLLKKFCWIFQSYLKSAKNIEELPLIIRFIEEEYNHNEIERILHLGQESLIDINQKIEEKPVEEIVDEFEINV